MENGENYYCQDCQSLETTYDTESSRVGELDIDGEDFDDEIEQELKHLRATETDDGSGREEATAETKDRQQDG